MGKVVDGIDLRDWRQFGEVVVDLHERVTVLTGANGTGKTAILRLLAQGATVGGRLVEPLVPVMSHSREGVVFLPPVRSVPVQESSAGPSTFRIGQVRYSNGLIGGLEAEIAPNEPFYHIVNTATDSEWVRQTTKPYRPGPGAYFPANRTGFLPQRVSAVSNDPASWWNKGDDPVRRALYSHLWPVADSGDPTNVEMKQALVSWAVFGYGNDAVIAEPGLRRHFDRFERVARQLLPERLGFRRFVVQNMDVLVETTSARFPFDSLSGGMASILELGWSLLFLEPSRELPIFVVIDEPENHLHAEMQRELLPKLVDAFPNAQFVVATHSPLVASSVRDAAVFALRFGEDGLVEQVRLRLDDWAGTASDVLRDALGLDATIPQWAEDRIRDVTQRYADSAPTHETFVAIRDDLAHDGLAEFAPRLIADVALREQPR